MHESSTSPVNVTGITSVDSAAISEKLKDLYKLMQETKDDQADQQHNLVNITKTHERMQADPQKPYYKQKLKGLYKIALQDAQGEENLIRKSLDLVLDIRRIIRSKPRKNAHGQPSTAMRRGALMKSLIQDALTLPLFIGKGQSDHPPPLCGSVPPESNYVGKLGDMVAALVKVSDGEENWILAEIVSYNHGTNKYEIDDIDEEQKERYTLSRRRVVPLPLMRANPETDPEAVFEKEALVLALYPQTTCFYRAVVKEPPHSGQEEYTVLFEDSTYSEGYSPPLSVPQRYVIMSRELRKK